MGARLCGGDGGDDGTGVDPVSLASGGAINTRLRGAGLGPIGIAAASSAPKASAGEPTVSA
jgi:hypothetical protein